MPALIGEKIRVMDLAGNEYIGILQARTAGGGFYIKLTETFVAKSVYFYPIPQLTFIKKAFELALKKKEKEDLSTDT